MVPQDAEAQPAPRGRGLSARWFLLIGLVIIGNIAAFILVPPFPREGAPGEACAFPVCFIDGTLEFPAPHTVIGPEAPGDQLIAFTPSISSTILTMWIVMAVVLIVVIVMTRRRDLLPGRAQNAFEYLYEFMGDFGMSIAGAAAKPYVPLFIAFFILILFSNWSGLIPPVGRIEQLRAPTSEEVLPDTPQMRASSSVLNSGSCARASIACSALTTTGCVDALAGSVLARVTTRAGGISSASSGNASPSRMRSSVAAASAPVLR